MCQINRPISEEEEEGRQGSSARDEDGDCINTVVVVFSVNLRLQRDIN